MSCTNGCCRHKAIVARTEDMNVVVETYVCCFCGDTTAKRVVLETSDILFRHGDYKPRSLEIQ
jgi:hypothetical protein